MSQANPDIASAIAVLAKEDRRKDEGGELVVPRRILLMLERKYQSKLSIKELCELYIREYYKANKSDK
jgi:hypothetical protein